MVRQDSMTTQAGQDWVDGTLDPEEYFRAARVKARESAQRIIKKRLDAEHVAPSADLQESRTDSRNG